MQRETTMNDEQGESKTKRRFGCLHVSRLLLAKNTDLADKVAIDLSPGLVSARILIPIDSDVPVIGGKTLRLKTGLSYSFAGGKPGKRKVSGKPSATASRTCRSRTAA